MRLVLVTLAVLFAVMAAGLIFGWDFGPLDDRAWRQHSGAWLALSVAAFAASCHPAADWFDERFGRRK